MAWQCDNCNHWTANGDKHNCINVEVERLQGENEELKRALRTWKLSFYCDGETPEKAELKELNFNNFVSLVEELDLD